MDQIQPDKMTCEILDFQGFLLQVFLGVLSFLVLIFKRHKERPKRQWKIWALDTSKQGVSALLAHMLNVILAIMLSNESSDDPCTWYFVTIFLDTTLGVFFCFIILNLFESLFDKFNLTQFKTGNYFQILTPGEQMSRKRKNGNSDNFENFSLLKPIVQIEYSVWIQQLFVWNLIVTISKTILYFISYLFKDILQNFGKFLFSWLDQKPNIKLVIVMVIIPSILNSFQFWMQDNFLKKNKFSIMEKEFIVDQMYEQDEEQQLKSTNNGSINECKGNGENRQIKSGSIQL